MTDRQQGQTAFFAGVALLPQAFEVCLGQAVDQGIKLGASLLQDAVNRAVSVSQNAGVRAMLVHALHDRAKAFYEHYGFQVSPLHPLTLMLRLNGAKL